MITKEDKKEEIMQHILADHDFDLDLITKIFNCDTCGITIVAKKKEKEE